MSSTPLEGDESTRIVPAPDDQSTRIVPAPEEAERTRIARSDPTHDEQTLIADPAAQTTLIVEPRPPSASGAAQPMTTAGAPGSSSGASPHNAFPVGTRLGEFEIVGVIGEGGFGIVYLAYDHSLDRKVALKEYMPAQLAQRQDGTVVLRSERHAETFAAGLRSFINEARLLAQFDHHSLVKVYRFWEANGTAYMVMPFYEGTTLKDVLKKMGAAPDENWLKLLLGHLLEALEIIHNSQCYHRDIAPDNILILPGEMPLLLDFGAARRVIGDMTQALTVILKPGYAPIEQYAEVPNMKQGPWTDLYALASVIFFAITGKAPVPSVARVMSDSLVPLAQSYAGRYSDSFLRALDWALAVKPEDRPQNIAQFRAALSLPEHDGRTRFRPPAAEPTGARALATAAAPSLPAASGAQPPGQVASAGTRRKLLIGGLAALVAVAVGALMYNFIDTAPKGPGVQATAPVAAPSAADLQAQVKDALAGLPCARLDATLDGTTAALRGHVGSDADLQTVKTKLGSVSGLTQVETRGVQVIPAVFCGIVAALAPHVSSAANAPAIGLKGGADVAREGDKLAVELTGPDFPGFVYADLYDAQRTVVHLLPNAKERKNEIRPRERLVIGDDPVFGMQWDVVPPLGKHLLVVTVSRSPLLDGRPDVEPAEKYAAHLDQALRQRGGDAAVSYRFVDFAPRP